MAEFAKAMFKWRKYASLDYSSIVSEKTMMEAIKGIAVCDTFARYCATGDATSVQAEFGVDYFGPLLKIGAAALARLIAAFIGKLKEGSGAAQGGAGSGSS